MNTLRRVANSTAFTLVLLAVMFAATAYIWLVRPPFVYHPAYLPVTGVLCFLAWMNLFRAWRVERQEARTYHPPVIAEFTSLEEMESAEIESRRNG